MINMVATVDTIDTIAMMFEMSYFGSKLNNFSRHPDRGNLLDPELLRVLVAEIHEVDRYLDRYPDYAVGLRALMTKARERVMNKRKPS